MPAEILFILFWKYFSRFHKSFPKFRSPNERRSLVTTQSKGYTLKKWRVNESENSLLKRIFTTTFFSERQSHVEQTMPLIGISLIPHDPGEGAKSGGPCPARACVAASPGGRASHAPLSINGRLAFLAGLLSVELNPEWEDKACTKILPIINNLAKTIYTARLGVGHVTSRKARSSESCERNELQGIAKSDFELRFLNKEMG